MYLYIVMEPVLPIGPVRGGENQPPNKPEHEAANEKSQALTRNLWPEIQSMTLHDKRNGQQPDKQY